MDKNKNKNLAGLPTDMSSFLPALLAAMPDMVAILNARGELLYINRALWAMPAKRLDRHMLGEMLSDASLARATAAIEEALRERQARAVEVEVCLDGSSRWFLVRFLPLPGDAQSRVLSISTEITDYQLLLNDMDVMLRRFRSLVYETPLAFMSFSEDWTIREWNPAAERMFGWSRDEALGKTPEQLMVRPEDVSRFQEEAEKIKGHAGNTITTFTNYHRDGHEVITRSFISPVHDDRGEVIGSDVLIEDISQQRKTLEELALSREMLDSHINNTPLACITWDRQLRVSSWNKAAEGLFGWGAEEAIGKEYREILVPPEYWNVTREGFERQFSGNGSAPNNLVSEVLRKDGARLICHSFNTPIRDAKGRVVAVASLVEDITERQQLMDELEASRRQLIDQLYNTPLAAIVWDPQFRVREWNHAAEQLYGYRREEAIGKFGYDLLVQGPDKRLAMERATEAFGSGSIPSRSTYHAWTRDGRKIYTENFNTPIRDASGKVVAISTLARDMTAEVQLQDALQRAKAEAEKTARAKSEFLANMSHEIRTPMHGIIGAIDLLASEACPEPVREYLRIIENSAQQLLGIINNVLDLSKIEAGAIQMAHDRFDLKELLESTLELLRPLAIKKGIDLTLGFPLDIPRFYDGDALRIRQVLTNLIGNAIKFTHQGGVQLLCQARSAGDGRKIILLQVVDTGIGITANKIRDIFRDFSQEDGSISREYGGTGLGLAISLKLSRLMGGDLAAESKPGEGSCFTLALPLDISQASPEVQAASLLPVHYGYKALIVDDNPVNLAIGVRMLEGLGLVVAAASSGEEAVSLFSQGDFDVVFMDLQMPVMDGFEAARKIQVMKNVPIVAMTANVLDKDDASCLAAGMNYYVGKPFQKADLIKVLNDIRELSH